MKNKLFFSEPRVCSWHVLSLKPFLVPMSDKHQFSPKIINMQTIFKTIFQTKRLWESIKWSPKESALIVFQILSTKSWRKCFEISLENLYADIGAWKVNVLANFRLDIPIKKGVHVNIGSDAAKIQIFGYSTGKRRTMTLPAGLANTVIVTSLP